MNRVKLVRGRWVFTGSAVIEQGAVVIDGDRIIETGSADALLNVYPNAEVIGSAETAVLPGFVNAHHHCHGVSTIQHGHADGLLEPWILGFAGLRRGDTYLETLLSMAQQLRSGVTSVVDVHSAGGSAAAYTQSVDDGLRACAEAGIRVAFATGTTTRCHLVHGEGEDQAFIDQLPAQLREPARALLPGPDRISDDEYLEIVSHRVRDFAAHPTIDVWFAPPGPQWVSDELMQRIAERAAALDTRIQTHCNESLYEKLHSERFYGVPTMRHLQGLGVLGPRFTIAHGVWLNQAEIEIMARSGVAVSHNPSSNLRLRAGIAPLPALLEAGVKVALGMDGTTLNEDEDYFTELRLALRLNRAPQIGARVPGVAQLFEMATAGGARLMGKSRHVGRLAPGFQADLMVLDLPRLCRPWVAPEADPLELIALRARRDDIETVIVNGNIAMHRGIATGFDETAAAEALAAHLNAQPLPDERAQAVRALIPHLEAWYRRWEVPELSPYLRYNAR